MAGGERGFVQLLAATHAGMTTDEFEKIGDGLDRDRRSIRRPASRSRRWSTSRCSSCSPTCAGNGFKTYIVSGGGIEFMRPWTEKVYGIPPEQVIGTQRRASVRAAGRQARDRQAGRASSSNDDKEGKPVGIQRHIGRRPIAAFGNSDGDLQMLQWTCIADGARFCLYVHHTDADREWAYDRDSHIGKLDKGLDEAKDRGWTVVDMKNDWKKIFASP